MDLINSAIAESQYWDAVLATAVQKQEYTLFEQLRPVIYQDGVQWCVLYGENLQTGIAGFGDTPHQAVMNFNDQWHKKGEDLLEARIRRVVMELALIRGESEQDTRTHLIAAGFI